MFQRIVFAAAISGLIAGLVVSAVQAVRVVPLILEAETFEKASPPTHPHTADTPTHPHTADTPTHPHTADTPAHPHTADTPAHPHAAGTPAHDHADETGIDLSRTALTAVSNVIAAIGFALLLIAGFVVHGGVDWKAGIFWGIGGFLAFSLAPSIRLPPELPGTFAAPVPNRQIWWAATAAGTSIGLVLLVFKPGASWKALGVAAIVLPHIIGAPHPERHGGLAPAELMHAFVVAALVSSVIFWAVLGACSGYFFSRSEKSLGEA
jgi:cobalt transporter subunit CbtA